jgi:hypothetical protein
MANIERKVIIPQDHYPHTLSDVGLKISASRGVTAVNTLTNTA